VNRSRDRSRLLSALVAAATVDRAHRLPLSGG